MLLAEFAIIQKNNDYDNTYDSKQKIDIAIVSFERFTEEFPELAEPYNNLAVLYLLQDRPERARLALERAILNNSNYELAYENLGDLYIYLANITYENGLSKLPKSIRLTKKIDHLKSMPLLTRPNIIKKLKK